MNMSRILKKVNCHGGAAFSSVTSQQEGSGFEPGLPVSVIGCLSLCVSPVMICPPVRGEQCQPGSARAPRDPASDKQIQIVDGH